MSHAIDHTHDPDLRSWVESANALGADFPVQNLPFGVFRRHGLEEPARMGVAIGDAILDLVVARDAGLLDGVEAAVACGEERLNGLMALPGSVRRELRRRLVEILAAGAPDDTVRKARAAFVDAVDVEMLVPARIGDYTDFYCSLHHAHNVGSMFRPDNPLFPNFKHLPIGYHGRASSIVVSDTTVRRPNGQRVAPGSETPEFGPSRSLDYELEVGAFVGPGNALGESIPIERAGDHIVGLCLLNDWSARDVQVWEYKPLGPFLGKSFATSVSPWVVTAEALAPFHCPTPTRAEGDPRPLPYLDSDANATSGGFDLTLEVWLSSERMRNEGAEAVRLSRGRFRDLYWTFGQMLAHHTSNGCNLHPGDLIASGTVSGADKDARGCLLEMTWRGSEPLDLPGGEQRRFLEDGDEVILRGFCEREGRARIGFGECRGMVTPA